MRSRDQRFDVTVPARIRWNGHWATAMVGNVSARGLMVRTAIPPAPGTYVEIQTSYGTITARATWMTDHACGFRAQDKLDVDVYRGEPTPASSSAGVAERTRAVATPRSIAEQAERSRQLSMMFQYAALGLVVASAAVGIGWEVYRVLSAPFAAIEARLN